MSFSPSVTLTVSASGTVTVNSFVPVCLLPLMVVSAVMVTLPPPLTENETLEPVDLFSVPTLVSLTVQETV